MPITVPAGVSVSIADGNVVTVKGPKGELMRSLRPEMIIKQEGNTITVDRPSDDKLHRSLHGLTRTLLNNMVNAGSAAIKQMPDGWTVRTLDGKWSAHYENSVLVTDGEPEILTAPAI